MTKPSKSKPSTRTETPDAEKPDDSTAALPKKAAAKPGTVTSSDVGAGTGAGASMKGGAISPADSAVVGKSVTAPPAAARKADAKPAEGAQPVKMTPPSEAKTETKTGSTPKPETPAAAKAAPEKDAGAQPAAKPASLPASGQNVTVKKTGFWPVVLGGVVAAALGSTATIWALPHLPAGWLPQGQTQSVDAEAIRAEAVAAAEQAAAKAVRNAAPAEGSAEASELQALLEAHGQRLAALELAEPTASGEAGGTAITDALADLRKQIEQQAAQIEQLINRPVIDPEAAGKVQSLAAQAEALEQQISAAAQSAQAQISAAQAEAAKLQEAAQDSTRRAEAVAAIAALKAALDRGVTPDEARDTLEDAGIATPEALQRAVPSLESLQAGFGDAARAALRASLRSDSASGGGNVITNFLRAQTGARSVAPREGADTDAVLSRANAKVEAGDIAGALNEMTALPDAARQAPAMTEWLNGAQAYREAHAALSDLSAATN